MTLLLCLQKKKKKGCLRFSLNFFLQKLENAKVKHVLFANFVKILAYLRSVTLGKICKLAGCTGSCKNSFWKNKPMRASCRLYWFPRFEFGEFVNKFGLLSSYISEKKHEFHCNVAK